MARVPTAIVLAASCLLVAACADSSSAPETSGARTVVSTPTGPFERKSEFREAGDDVCSDAQLEAADLARRHDDLERQREALSEEAFLRRYSQIWLDRINYLERLRASFRALGRSPGEARFSSRFVRSLRELLVIARRIERQAEDGHAVPDELVADYEAAVARGTSLLRGYGFDICGRAPIL